MEPDCRRAPAYLLRVLFLFAVSLSYSSAFPYDRPSLGDVYSEYTDLKPTDLRHGIFNDLPQVIIPLPGWLDKHRHHNTKEQNDKTEQHEATGYRGAVGYYDTPGQNIIINIYPIEISFSESEESYEESKSSSEEWPRSSEEKTSSSEEWTRSSEEKTSSSEEQLQSSEEKPSSSEEWPRSSEEKTSSSEEQLQPSEEKPSSSEEWPRSSEEKPSSSEENLQSSEDKPSSSEEWQRSSEEKPSSSEEWPRSSEEKPSSSEEQLQSSEEKPSSSEEWPRSSEEKPSSSEEWPRSSEEKPSSSEEQLQSSEEKPSSSEEWPRSSKEKPSSSEEQLQSSEKKSALSEKNLISIKSTLASDGDALVANLLHKHKTTKIKKESSSSQISSEKQKTPYSLLRKATLQEKSQTSESQIPASHSLIKKATSQAEAQKPEADSPETQVPPVTKKGKHCSFKHLSSCYVVADMLLKFDDCSKRCQNSSYDVVVPKSAETKAFLHKQMGGSVNTLSRTNIYPYWLGIKFTNNAWHLHAKSSEAVGYSNWVPDTPMSPSNDACAAADLNDSLWRISECTDVALCVCESSVQQSKR
ncbi:uncharacterized protein LOC131935608 [Physella acuta]|uniref:uncharacterized protein LOC131935608 n=1 Tax=Physella acuta TaxID=109671 RepID=UPI0027DB60ED|nr:uncharacterized protein LOC131935608 [Physella acuta]